MLRAVHKHKRSIGMLFIFLAVAIMMTGFGLDSYLGTRLQPYAIRVNDEEVTFAQFYDSKRNLESQMRRMYGGQFDQIAQLIGFDASRQTADRIVADKVLGQTARSFGLTVGDREVFEAIQSNLFPSGFNQAAYLSYLRSIQKTPMEFENEMRGEMLSAVLYDIIKDSSAPSLAEARAAARIERTKYDVEYLEFDPSDATTKVSEPTQEQLEAFYKERAAEYQTQPLISYGYVTFSPKDVVETIEISPEDIEFFYSENEAQFTEPESVKLRSIEIKYPEKADDKAREKVKADAEGLVKKIREGGSFEELAKKHSADKATGAKGGDIGWKTQSDLLPYVAQVVFRLTPGEISDIVSIPGGYQILKVEEKKAQSLKPLDAVRNEIITLLRAEEAPAVSAAKAYEAHSAWEKSGKALKDYAGENKLSFKSTESPRASGSDPEPELMGLTEQAFGYVDARKGIVELKDRTVLVEIAEFKEATLPNLTEIKDRVVKDWKASQSSTKAKEIAEASLKALQETRTLSIADAASKFGGKSGEIKEVTMATANAPALAGNDARRFVFSAASAPALAPSVSLSGGKYYVLKVTKVTPPADQEINENLTTALRDEKDSLARATFNSLLAKLKAKADIDVKASVYGESGEG